jgi:hypothetical protein
LDLATPAPASVVVDIFRGEVRFTFNPIHLTQIKFSYPETFERIFNFICLHETFHLVKEHLSFSILTTEEWTELIRARHVDGNIDDISKINEKIGAKLKAYNYAMDMEINPIVMGIFGDDVDNFFCPQAKFSYAFPREGFGMPYIIYYSALKNYIFDNYGDIKEIKKEEREKIEENFSILKDNVEQHVAKMMGYLDKVGPNNRNLLYRILRETMRFIEDHWLSYGYDYAEGTVNNYFAFAHYRAKQSLVLVQKTKLPNERSAAIIEKRILDLKNHKSPVAILNQIALMGSATDQSGMGVDIIISMSDDGMQATDSQGNPVPIPPNINELLEKIKKKLESLAKQNKENVSESYENWKKTCGHGSLHDIEKFIADIPPPIPLVKWDKILQGVLVKLFSKLRLNDLVNTRRSTIFVNKVRKPVMLGNIEYDTTSRVAIILDVSDSMGDKEIMYLVSVIMAVAHHYGIPLYIFQADDELIDHYDVIRTPAEARKFKMIRRGHGGTEFGGPIKKVIEKVHPQIILYVTDLCGRCGDPPPGTRVVWLATNSEYKPTYGTLIELNPTK